jgi:hypothetical protein
MNMILPFAEFIQVTTFLDYLENDKGVSNTNDLNVLNTSPAYSGREQFKSKRRKIRKIQYDQGTANS